MNLPLTTTLNRIYDYMPCRSRWRRGLKAAGKTQPDNEPITYAEILDAVGLKDALWCCRAEPQHASTWRRYAVWCSRRVQHLMTDPRSVAALDVAERHANELATDAELHAAWAAACAAARDAAGYAAWDATRNEAWHAAKDAAGVAARAAALAAALAAAWDADWDAARNAAWDAALAAERQIQAAAFRQLVTTGTLP